MKNSGLNTKAIQCSVVVTVRNEASTVTALLGALAAQSQKPAEVIITDAGSSDGTAEVVKQYQSAFPVRLFTLPPESNRSVGRNEGVKQATYEHILITDAGCTPDPKWVEQMLLGFQFADVVAGVAHPKTSSIFEKAVAPYALVMPDRVNPSSYLPATRALGITKKLWKQMGGLNEKYRFAEDYEFARRLVTREIPIQVQTKAIVYWQPRSNLQSFYSMIYQHARGDAYSHTFRPKVLTIFARYIVFLLLGVFGVSNVFSLATLIVLLVLYCLYAVQKNIRYVPTWQALIILPILQVVSDIGVMVGTVTGMLLSIPFPS